MTTEDKGLTAFLERHKKLLPKTARAIAKKLWRKLREGFPESWPLGADRIVMLARMINEEFFEQEDAVELVARAVAKQFQSKYDDTIADVHRWFDEWFHMTLATSFKQIAPDNIFSQIDQGIQGVEKEIKKALAFAAVAHWEADDAKNDAKNYALSFKKAVDQLKTDLAELSLYLWSKNESPIYNEVLIRRITYGIANGKYEKTPIADVMEAAGIDAFKSIFHASVLYALKYFDEHGVEYDVLTKGAPSLYKMSEDLAPENAKDLEARFFDTIKDGIPDATFGKFRTVVLPKINMFMLGLETGKRVTFLQCWEYLKRLAAFYNLSNDNQAIINEILGENPSGSLNPETLYSEAVKKVQKDNKGKLFPEDFGPLSSKKSKKTAFPPSKTQPASPPKKTKKEEEEEKPASTPSKPPSTPSLPPATTPPASTPSKPSEQKSTPSTPSHPAGSGSGGGGASTTTPPSVPTPAASASTPKKEEEKSAGTPSKSSEQKSSPSTLSPPASSGGGASTTTPPPASTAPSLIPPASAPPPTAAASGEDDDDLNRIKEKLLHEFVQAFPDLLYQNCIAELASLLYNEFFGQPDAVTLVGKVVEERFPIGFKNTLNGIEEWCEAWKNVANEKSFKKIAQNYIPPDFGNVKGVERYLRALAFAKIALKDTIGSFEEYYKAFLIEIQEINSYLLYMGLSSMTHLVTPFFLRMLTFGIVNGELDTKEEISEIMHEAAIDTLKMIFYKSSALLVETKKQILTKDEILSHIAKDLVPEMATEFKRRFDDTIKRDMDHDLFERFDRSVLSKINVMDLGNTASIYQRWKRIKELAELYKKFPDIIDYVVATTPNASEATPYTILKNAEEEIHRNQHSTKKSKSPSTTVSPKPTATSPSSPPPSSPPPLPSATGGSPPATPTPVPMPTPTPAETKGGTSPPAPASSSTSPSASSSSTNVAPRWPIQPSRHGPRRAPAAPTPHHALPEFKTIEELENTFRKRLFEMIDPIVGTHKMPQTDWDVVRENDPDEFALEVREFAAIDDVLHGWSARADYARREVNDALVRAMYSALDDILRHLERISLTIEWLKVPVEIARWKELARKAESALFAQRYLFVTTKGVVDRTTCGDDKDRLCWDAIPVDAQLTIIDGLTPAIVKQIDNDRLLNLDDGLWQMLYMQMIPVEVRKNLKLPLRRPPTPVGTYRKIVEVLAAIFFRVGVTNTQIAMNIPFSCMDNTEEAPAEWQSVAAPKKEEINADYVAFLKLVTRPKATDDDIKRALQHLERSPSPHSILYGSA